MKTQTYGVKMVLPVAALPSFASSMPSLASGASLSSFLPSLGSVGNILSGIGSLGGLFGGGGLSPRKAAALQHQYWTAQVRDELPLRVEGAKAAGLHPLAALGINSSAGGVSIPVGSRSKFDSVREFGQDISRAAGAYDTKSDRLRTEISQNLALENQKLQNDLLRSQISHANSSKIAGSPPPLSSGATSADFEIVPHQITAGKGGTLAGRPIQATIEVQNRDGSTFSMPNPELNLDSELLHSVTGADWFMRNRATPFALKHSNGIRSAYKKVWWNPANW